MACPEHRFFAQFDFGSFSQKLESTGEFPKIVPLHLQSVDGVNVRFMFQFPAVPENGTDHDHREQVTYGVDDTGIDASVISGTGGSDHDVDGDHLLARTAVFQVGVPIDDVRDLMREHAGDLRLVLHARQQPRVHVDGSVGERKGVDLQIADRPETPCHVLRCLRGHQRRTKFVEVGVGLGIVVNPSLLLHVGVKGVDLSQELKIDLAELKVLRVSGSSKLLRRSLGTSLRRGSLSHRNPRRDRIRLCL